MSTDIFLGALVILFFVAVVIFLMTTNLGERSQSKNKDKVGR